MAENSATVAMHCGEARLCCKLQACSFSPSGDIIKSYISFVTGNTRLATSNKLQHNRSTDMMANNFYFNRLPHLWNALPIIDINLHPDNIKQKLLHYFWNHFKATFDSSNTCNLSFQCCCSKCNNQPTTTNFNILN